MSVQLFTLIPQSNLHAGAGSSNYGVIDNLVQRDVTDQYPCVYASSLKGAFREHYEEVIKRTPAETEAVFGGTEKKGGYVFSDAHLLALPVRSNQRAYFMATCPALMQKFLDVVMKDYDCKSDTIKALEKEIHLLKSVSPLPKIIGQPIENLKIEDFDDVKSEELTIPELKKLLGDDIVLLSDDDMQYQCSDYALPVLARNCLDNGQSTNLWYEQIIPRKTVFYFLAEKMTSTHPFDIGDKPVQVGGNATVGYGRCRISKL